MLLFCSRLPKVLLLCLFVFDTRAFFFNVDVRRSVRAITNEAIFSLEKCKLACVFLYEIRSLHDQVVVCSSRTKRTLQRD